MSISAPITATADCPVKALLRRPGGSLAMLTDAKGGTSHVTIKDVMQSNGVIHVVDTVLMP